MNNIFIKNTTKLSIKESPYNIGFDLKATSIEIVGEKINGYYRSIDYIQYGTNIFIDSLKRKSDSKKTIYSLIYPRSSISNKNLLLCNSVGIIDPNYRDEVLIRFKYIAQPKDFRTFGDINLIEIDESKIYQIGNKIVQLVFSENIDVVINYVSELIPSDRSGGFGSTGE